MSFRSRVLPFVALAAVIAPHVIEAQEARSEPAKVAQVRDNRFKWFFGAEAGAMFFKTQIQSTTGIPSVGAHISVVSRRGGLIVGVDEAFGSNESTAFLDPSAGFAQRTVSFDRIRRYGLTLTGYPVRGMVEPYLGVGFGLTQVISPTVEGTFASPDEYAFSAAAAREISATGFASLMGGLQFRVGRLAAFGQYQINTSPSPDNLLRGPLHLLIGGLRFSLGSAREDVKGGGY
jgi:hypothetical protein